MRLGVYGGSFDPIHLGHLWLAQACREACALDELWFVPAFRSPHKLAQDVAPGEHRLAMVRLALQGVPWATASDLELTRGGTSFTVETLERIHAARPDAELFLVLGSDALRDFATWRAPVRIAELATLAVAQRGGRPDDESRRARERLEESIGGGVRCVEFAMPRIEVSSSELRERAKAGLSLRFRTPDAVAEYVGRHGLYGASAEGSAT